jgi:phage regulator Rha-like protein
MKLNKGFSMIGLMAVVAIVAIIAVVSLPVYNQYIERTKVSKEIPVIGTYKNDIASCFMKNDSLEDCNDGESGIHPGLDNNGKILSLDVFKGNIVMIIDAQNHIEDIEPIELMYIVNPNVDATFPTLDWNLYCNDYSSDNNALVKECKGLITDKDGDGYDDSVEEEWGSDPLDPDSVPVNWQSIEPLFTDWTNNGGRVYTSDWSPEASNQTSDFTQTRSYNQEQTRERTDREQDSFSGDIRIVDVVTETQTLSGEESRNVVVNNTSGGWVDTGSTYACSDWIPPASDYYETQMIDQTRVCSQDQESTYNYSVGGSFTDTQTVNVTEERTVEGTQPLWVDISDDISPWTNVGSRNYTSDWSPEANGQSSNFTQTRSYTQEQERTISEREQNQLNGDIRVVSSTTEEQTINGEESRVVSVNIGAWVNTGSTFSCGAWTPAANTAYETQDVEQTRVCSKSQERIYSYSNGESYTETQTVSVTEERTVEGTQPLWVDISDDVSDWTNVGGRNYTSAWSPEANGQTSDFTQTRSYTQEQERTISEREQNQLNGDIRVVNSTTEEQTISGVESRVVSVTIGAWVDTGSTFSCGAWTPAANTAYETQDVEQTRVCSQSQERVYSYNNGESYTETQTVSVTEERTVEGTQPLWVDISNDVSDWANVGSRSYTSSWEPNIIGQTSDFTQTRSYTQEQERTISEREENQLTGDIRVVSSTTETQTINGEESRNVSVSETAWQNVGGVFDCSAWSPATSTVDEGQSFTQSRDCLQEQEKTYTYSANSSTIGSMTINRDVQTTQTRQATGTNPVWVSIAPSYSTWTDVGSRTYTSGWSPAATNQTSDFTQTRSYTQEQERTVSQREERPATGDIRVVGTSTETRTISDSTSRTVTVSEGAWINDGSVYGCGAWSPALGSQTSDFTQTRSCSQDQTKTYTYSVGGSFTAERTITVSQSQVVEVTSTAGGSGDGWSSWSTYSTSCGSWGPSTGTVNQGQTFTQTRSCTDYQERFKYFVVNGQVVDSDRETRTTSRTESITATGTKAITGSFVYLGFYDARTGQVGYSNGGYTGSDFIGAPVVDKRTYDFSRNCTIGEKIVSFLPMGGQNYGIYEYYICR